MSKDDAEKLRQKFVAQIDETYNAALKNLAKRHLELEAEEERIHQERQTGLEWAMGIPDALLPYFANGNGLQQKQEPPPAPEEEASDDSSENESSSFQFRKAFRDYIIGEMSPAYHIDTPRAYKALRERHEWVRNHSNPPRLRARIGGMLKALVDEGILELVADSQGRYPATYKKISNVVKKKEFEAAK